METFQLQENTSGNYSSDNLIVNLLRSRIGAILLVLVSLMQPVEAFSAQCQLKSPPVCLDSTPCKDVPDPMFPGNSSKTIKVCLSNAAQVGAMTTSATCWNYSSTYDCLDPATVPTYTDSCAPIKADTTGCPSYAETASTCALPLSANGTCPSFDVTYQCVSRPGQPYQEQSCNGVSLCVGSTCTVGNPEKSVSFAKVAAAAEVARQLGVYATHGDGNPASMDPNAIRVFTGEAGNCSQNTMGMSDCCKPDARGGNYTNQILVQELMKHGWNAWVGKAVGSNYTYDTLFDSTKSLIVSAYDGMTAVINRWMDNGAGSALNTPTPVNPPPQVVGTPAPTVKPVSGLTSLGYTAGGFVGGMGGGQAGAWVAQKGQANFQATGVIVALGTTAGTVAGTALAGSIIGAAGTVGTVGTEATVMSGAFSGAGTAMGTICTPCIVAALVIAIVMALVACDQNEIKLQLKLGAGICHWVGSFCGTQGPLGNCMTRKQEYCCFNSKIAKIIQEQGRPQLGRGWGVAGASPDCGGLSITELSALNFATMDFSEFVRDIVPQNVPDPAQLSAQIVAQTRAFFTTNSGNPTATNGVIVPVPVTQRTAFELTATDPTVKPVLAACNVALVQSAPAVDGSITGTFSVTSCNANAKLIWSYIGTCAAVPKYATLDLIPADDMSTTDAAGAGTFVRALPASCLVLGSPAIYNAWKGLVNDPTAGLLGTITAPW